MNDEDVEDYEDDDEDENPDYTEIRLYSPYPAILWMKRYTYRNPRAFRC